MSEHVAMKNASVASASLPATTSPTKHEGEGIVNVSEPFGEGCSAECSPRPARGLVGRGEGEPTSFASRAPGPACGRPSATRIVPILGDPRGIDHTRPCQL
jgi:hypothetical protein